MIPKSGVISTSMSSADVSARFSKLPIAVEQLGLIDYNAAWDRQRELAAARADDIGPDTLLLLEHPPVYTAGRRTEPEDRPVDGTPVIDVDRGGKITWHGPGQLVGYPIVKLAEPIDVVRYVRRIEEALITVCTDLGLELRAHRRPLRRLAARRTRKRAMEARAQGFCHRRARPTWRGTARLLPELQFGPDRIRQHHSLRHP